MGAQPIYQLYAVLDDYEPKIWRRFQVAGNITMARLGYVLMTMYEMQANHLFCFDFPLEKYFLSSMLEKFSETDINRVLKGTDFLKPENKNWHFEIPNEETDDFQEKLTEKLFDATKTTLDKVVTRPNEALIFTYDFGDSWQVSVHLEEIVKDADLPGSELPRVLDGAGYGIIEDCGGIPGLEDLAKAFKKKKGEQYEQYCDWLGRCDLDLTTFDLDDMNFRLKKVPQIFRGLYEMGFSLTKKSQDILDRNYLEK